MWWGILSVVRYKKFQIHSPDGTTTFHATIGKLLWLLVSSKQIQTDAQLSRNLTFGLFPFLQIPRHQISYHSPDPAELGHVLPWDTPLLCLHSTSASFNVRSR